MAVRGLLDGEAVFQSSRSLRTATTVTQNGVTRDYISILAVLADRDL